MKYNFILSNGNLKFDTFFDAVAQQKDGTLYAMSKLNREGDNKDCPSVLLTPIDPVAASQKGTTMHIEGKNGIVITPKNVTYTTATLPEGRAYLFYSDKKGKYTDYIMIEGKVGISDRGSFEWRQLFEYSDIKVLGFGRTTFTNQSIDFDSTKGEDLIIGDGRFAIMKAGASGSERKVYNFFDLKKGTFLFPDRFVYDIKLNGDRITVHDSKNGFPSYYDLDGKPIERDTVKDEIKYPSDRYRKFKIGKTNPIDVFVVRHAFARGVYAIFKSYDYNKQEFTDEICTFVDGIRVVDLDKTEENGKPFKIDMYNYTKIPFDGMYHGNYESNTFTSRKVDEVIEIDEGNMLIYKNGEGNMCYMDISDCVEHVMYQPNEYERISMTQWAIYDYKRKDIIIFFTYKDYGHSVKAVNMKGEILCESPSSPSYINYREVYLKNGFIALRRYNNEERTEYTVFHRYNPNNGKIEEVDMNGVIPYRVESDGETLFVTDRKTEFVHKYDDELNCIDDENIVMQMFNSENRGGYAFVVYNKETKMYRIQTHEADREDGDYFDMILDGEPYKPKNIIILASKGNSNYHNKSDIALIAERYVDGKLKKTFFINDGERMRERENQLYTSGRKWYTIGEYDDIKATDSWGHENSISLGMKKDLENSRIVVRNGKEKITYALTIDPSGNYRTIKKRT